jgi:hypothetical protein
MRTVRASMPLLVSQKLLQEEASTGSRAKVTILAPPHIPFLVADPGRGSLHEIAPAESPCTLLDMPPLTVSVSYRLYLLFRSRFGCEF